MLSSGMKPRSPRAHGPADPAAAYQRPCL